MLDYYLVIKKNGFSLSISGLHGNKLYNLLYFCSSAQIWPCGKQFATINDASNNEIFSL